VAKFWLRFFVNPLATGTKDAGVVTLQKRQVNQESPGIAVLIGSRKAQPRMGVGKRWYISRSHSVSLGDSGHRRYGSLDFGIMSSAAFAEQCQSLALDLEAVSESAGQLHREILMARLHNHENTELQRLDKQIAKVVRALAKAQATLGDPLDPLDD
jgi:hypothetical protein